MLSHFFEVLPTRIQRQLKIALPSIGRAIHITANGTLIFDDIHRRLKEERFEIIFDVGANVGQSALTLCSSYPGAKIYSFEPAANTFQALQCTLKLVAGSVAVNLGMGEMQATVRFDDRGPSVLNKIADQTDEKLPLVRITTVDDYCTENGIPRIDYLKIDTEGNDLKVLKGASKMLSNSNIGVVVAECSMSPDNIRHVAFCEIYQFLCPMGYRVFGLYEQTPEFYDKKPNLRRANVAYISDKVIHRNSL